jgi:hypothetical protein
MKKVFFGLIATIMFSVTGFASNEVEKRESDKRILVRASSSKEELNCAEKGGVCLLSYQVNGTRQTREVCCNDIVVVKLPKTINTVE